MNDPERAACGTNGDLRMPTTQAFEGLHDFGSTAAAAERSRSFLANEAPVAAPRTLEAGRRDSREASRPLLAAVGITLLLLVLAALLL
ncbi:MAG: hypothetical protein JNL90_14425 [Planctomycetes bacterium]|nr:hypothetical protein [Planctomycetota bacterium]